MALNPNLIYHSRAIDAIAGTSTERVYSALCGATPCEISTFMGRKVDVVDSVSVYAVASECCYYPLGYNPEWVHRDKWPPSTGPTDPIGGTGISKLLLLRVTGTQTCTEFHCLEQYAEADPGTGTGSGDDGTWTWMFGPIVLNMAVDPLAASGLTFSLDGSTCPVSFATAPVVECAWPLRVSVQLSPSSSECCQCCPDTTSRIYIDIIGFCDRIRKARFVDVIWDEAAVGYKKVFAYADCCETIVCPPLDCCIDFNCTLLACFFPLGTCTCLDGCYRLTPSTTINPPALSGWSNTLVGSCGHVWNIEIGCLGLETVGTGSGTGTGTGIDRTVARFSYLIQSTCNCSASGETSTFQDCGPDFDIEFEIAIDCPECEPSPPAPTPPCCDCGSYSYLVRLTRADCIGYMAAAADSTEWADPAILTLTGPADPPASRTAVVTLSVGPVGRALLAVSGPVFAAYAARVGADYVVIEGPDDVPYPVGVKFAIRDLLADGGYERALFFDADAILDRNCPDLFALVPPGHVGIHDDAPFLQDKSWVQPAMERLYASQGWDQPSGDGQKPLPPPNTVYNTGVVVLDRAVRDAFLLPPSPYPAGHLGEQNLVNANIARMDLPVSRLPIGLNFQWWMPPAVAGDAPVHVWHFANCPDEHRPTMMSRKRSEVSGV